MKEKEYLDGALGYANIKKDDEFSDEEYFNEEEENKNKWKKAPRNVNNLPKKQNNNEDK